MARDIFSGFVAIVAWICLVRISPTKIYMEYRNGKCYAYIYMCSVDRLRFRSSKRYSTFGTSLSVYKKKHTATECLRVFFRAVEVFHFIPFHSMFYSLSCFAIFFCHAYLLCICLCVYICVQVRLTTKLDHPIDEAPHIHTTHSSMWPLKCSKHIVIHKIHKILKSFFFFRSFVRFFPSKNTIGNSSTQSQ